jgi:hypothetical protein
VNDDWIGATQITTRSEAWDAEVAKELERLLATLEYEYVEDNQ